MHPEPILHALNCLDFLCAGVKRLLGDALLDLPPEPIGMGWVIETAQGFGAEIEMDPDEAFEKLQEMGVRIG